MRHSGNHKKVIPAGWLPSVPERMLPLFRVRRDKAGTALTPLGPISSVGIVVSIVVSVVSLHRTTGVVTIDATLSS